MVDVVPASPLLGMYQTNGAFPTPGPSAWASGPRTNLTAQYMAWGQDIPTYATAFFTQCGSNQLIPFFELEPWNAGDNWTDVPLFTDITSGQWDSWLQELGEAIAAFGKTVILTFAHEFNLVGQYPWAYGDTGSGPGGGQLSAAQWILGWKYVHDKINQYAGGHALWMWAPGAWQGTTNQNPNSWWPGASYVDMVGIDGYPSSEYGADLVHFAGQFGQTVTSIRNLGWNKPIFLSETNLHQMVQDGETIPNFVRDFYNAGCSGILEFEDAAWGLSPMTTSEWSTYASSINQYFGTSTGGGGTGGGGTGGGGTGNGYTYTQTVYDNFDDDSFDTTKWATPNGTTGIAETSGTLNITARTSSPEADSKTPFDLTTGVWAVKWGHTGTGTADPTGAGTQGTETYFGFIDADGNSFEIDSWPVSNFWHPLAGTGATVGTATGAQNAFASAWSDGDYVGFGDYDVDDDNVLHVYKSSDGETWTEIASFEVTGAIDMTAVMFFFGVDQLNGSSTWVSTFDEASTFLRAGSGGGGDDGGGGGGGGGTGYVQSIIDNFDDNSFNTHIWSTDNGTTGLSETGQTLHIQANNAYTAAKSLPTFDLSKGILGAQITVSGTVTDSDEVYIFIHDGTNSAAYASDPSSGYHYWLFNQDESTSTDDIAGDGVGPSWVSGDWMGLGNYDPATKSLYAYKSHDGLTWTQVGRATVDDFTLNYTSCGVGLMAGNYASGVTFAFTAVFDNASTFLLTSTPGGGGGGGGGWDQTLIDNFNDNSIDDDIWTVLTDTSGGGGYTQTIIDNFNDNSFNTSIWGTPDGSTGITETSGALHIHSTAANQYNEVDSPMSYDLTEGILAFKWSWSGTATGMEVYLGVSDADINNFGVYAQLNSNSWTTFANGAATAGATTGSQSAFHSNFTSGHWLGMGNIGSDNILHIYTSTDGVTWTEIATVAYTGTFDKTAAGFIVVLNNQTSAPTYIWTMDDASYFSTSSIDTGVHETGQHLEMLSQVLAHAAGIELNDGYDITDSMLAFKYTRSGSATADEFFSVQVYDSAGNGINLTESPHADSWAIDIDGAATHTADTGDATALGSDWDDGDWLGVGQMGSDHVLGFYKSSDGVTWTKIISTTVGGTFDKTSVTVQFWTGSTAGTSTWKAILDDMSYFEPGEAPPSSGTTKVRVSGAWVNAVPKVRVGGSWVVAVPKARVGGAWVPTS